MSYGWRIIRRRRRVRSGKRQSEIDDADGEKKEVDSRDKARRIERNDQLYVTRIMQTAE